MLSVCMMVKNEAHCLRRCLNSIRDLEHELIIVDTGSTDSTPEICREFGALVIPFDFSDIDFAAARNCGLDVAQGDWVLVLDADESLRQDCLPLLRELIGQKGDGGYFVERVNHASDSAAPTIDYLVRLFAKRKEFRFRHRVHETIDDSILSHGGHLLKSSIVIDHEFITDRTTRRRKNRAYIEILTEELAADPTDLSRLDFLAAEYHQLEMYEEAAEILERLARMRPRDARAHLFAGTYHLLFKPDLLQARIDLNEALRLRPNYTEAAYFLQLLNRQIERVSGAPELAVKLVLPT